LSNTDSDSASPLHDSSVASDDTYRIPFSDTNSDKSEPMPEDPWERLEYARRHLRLYQSEEEYQEARARVEVIVEKQRERRNARGSRKAGIANALASERISQPRASSPRPPKDTSRRTRGGRVTKNAAQSQSVANRWIGAF
jgi:hypothetical protein